MNHYGAKHCGLSKAIRLGSRQTCPRWVSTLAATSAVLCWQLFWDMATQKPTLMLRWSILPRGSQLLVLPLRATGMDSHLQGSTSCLCPLCHRIADSLFYLRQLAYSACHTMLPRIIIHTAGSRHPVLGLPLTRISCSQPTRQEAIHRLHTSLLIPSSCTFLAIETSFTPSHPYPSYSHSLQKPSTTWRGPQPSIPSAEPSQSS